MESKSETNERFLDDPSVASHDVILIAKIKNEYKRIPFFMQYYRIIGIKHFIFIDNGSSDRTLEYLSKQEDARVLIATELLSNHHRWIKKALDTRCVNHWVLIVDLDEFFCFPGIECAKIDQVVGFLESMGYNAVKSILLDMYPRGCLSEADIGVGQSPLSVLRYFDKNTHIAKYGKIYGGVRKRVFDAEPCLTKFPLIKYNLNMEIGPGMHSVKGIVSTDITAALLHCKFDSDFETRTAEAVKSGTYWNNSEEYKKYAAHFVNNKDLVMFESGTSILYIDSDTLITKGIIGENFEFQHYLSEHANPRISIVICTNGEDRISRDLLTSIKIQSFTNFEVIVVDNNEVQKIMSVSEINCRIIHEKREGLSIARNRGIESSQGDYILFIDSDVVLDRLCLENLYRGSNTYMSDLVGARVVLRSDIGRHLTKKERRFVSELIYESDIEVIKFPKYIVGACMMFKRNTFLKYGLFSTAFGRRGASLMSGEETEFIKRIIKFGGKVSYINSSVCTHNIDLKRIKLRYLLKRAFWQGATDYKLDNVFDEHKIRKHKFFGSNIHDILLNISRFIGYKIFRQN